MSRVGRGADLIGIEPEARALVRLRAAESTGRPLDGDDFLSLIERRLGRSLLAAQAWPDDEYLKRSPDPNMNMYQWLQTQSYDVQREEGLQILRDLHILK